MDHSRFYGDSADFETNPLNNFGKYGKNRRQLDLFTFFEVVQAQILRKDPRRSCGSFWSGLELQRSNFDRFLRHLFTILFVVLTPKI